MMRRNWRKRRRLAKKFNLPLTFSVSKLPIGNGVGARTMAMSATAKLNEDLCPVSDDCFSELRQAEPPDAVEIAKTLPAQQRADLATFCYSRRHLHALGLMIASTCECRELVEASASAGPVLYQQSRDPDRTLAQESLPAGHRPPKPVSLAQTTTE